VIDSLRKADRNLIALTAVVLVALPIPVFLSTPQMEIAVRIILFALISIGWNVMGGFAGYFSFGHAAFFGIGAYTGAWLLTNWGWSPWLGMIVGATLAGLFAVLTGYLSFRYKLTGAYFALATLAFAEMLRHIATHSELVNRARGFQVPLLREHSWWMLQFPPGSPSYYFSILGLFALAMLAVIFLMRSRAGYYIVALREDEAAAASLGVSPMRYKLLAVAISGAITGVGGVFFFQFLFFVDPDLAFGASISVQAILPAIIGGTGTIWGPAIGSFVLVGLGEVTSGLTRNPPELLSFLGGRSGLELMIFGVILIVIILFLPRGLYGTIAKRMRS
jgi:branched-chain amino acid transport system permease protein